MEIERFWQSLVSNQGMSTASNTVPGKVEPASRLRRAFAVIEVIGVFALTHLLLKSFKQFSNLGTQERSAGLNLSPGLFMVAVVIMILLLTHKDWKTYGLWPLTLPRRLSRPAWKIILAGVLLYVPPLFLFLYFKHGNVLLVFAGLLTTTAFGEEIFYRGYIQSRLNEVFGRPYAIRGVRFGAGLFIATLLFGFLHALNTADYLHGHYAFDWTWAAGSLVPGLMCGLMREATGNILTGSIVHGLWDVWIYGALAFFKNT